MVPQASRSVGHGSCGTIFFSYQRGKPDRPAVPYSISISLPLFRFSPGIENCSHTGCANTHQRPWQHISHIPCPGCCRCRFGRNRFRLLCLRRDCLFRILCVVLKRRDFYCGKRIPAHSTFLMSGEPGCTSVASLSTIHSKVWSASSVLAWQAAHICQ